MKASPGRSVFFILISLLILSNASCKGTSGAGNAGEAKKTRIAFITNNASDFWTIARKGTEKAAAELPNIEIEFKINSETTAAGQQRIVDDLLAKGVDGIAISPVDPKNQTQLINRAASQAVVFTQDSDAPNSNRTCYIGTDNVAAGRQAGDLVKEALPEGGRIMVFVGTMDVQNAQERYRGLEEALKGSKIEIIGIRTDEADSVRAKRNAADTLVKYADIAGMVGLWSYNGPAILGAVKEAGKVGKVKIVAFDEEDATLTGVKEGAVYATVVQQPFEFGYQSMIKLAKAIGGDKSGIPSSKLDIVPTLPIKKDGVDEFTVKLNKLRGRS
ncbi:MAG TPA: sugar-binding protein [Blastocatellia bacterium]